MKKIKFWIYPIILIGVFFIFVNSCKKSDESTTENKTTAVFNPNKTYGTMTDIDGNVYKTITIGTQIWMAENLRTTHYRDGSAIPSITDNTAWITQTTGTYCWYDNDATAYKATYGALYNWYTVVDSRNLCPTGWHIPTNAEWTQLTDYLSDNAGGKLKETGTTHWVSPNTGATNETGFTALPSGRRVVDGSYMYIGSDCDWWSTTESNAGSYSTDAFQWNVNNYSSTAYRYVANKEAGLSVRCIRD